MIGPYEVLLLVVFVVVPALVTRSIGASKQRRYGIAYGLLLSWLGVLTIAVLPSLEPKHP